MFTKSWSEAKTRTQQSQIPDGKYHGVMSNVKQITGKASGKEMMCVEFIITNPGGPGDRQKLSKFYMFDDMGLSNIKTDLEMAHLEIEAPESEMDLVQKVYDLCPAHMEIYVKNKADKTGTMRTNVYINGPWTSDGTDTFAF
jgi:hypothetical protein